MVEVDVAAVRARLRDLRAVCDEHSYDAEPPDDAKWDKRKTTCDLAIAALDQQQREIATITKREQEWRDECDGMRSALAEFACEGGLNDLLQDTLNEEIGAHNRAKADFAAAKASLESWMTKCQQAVDAMSRLIDERDAAQAALAQAEAYPARGVVDWCQPELNMHAFSVRKQTCKCGGTER